MESRLYPNLILDALKNVRYPGNGKNIVALGMIADDIRIDGNKVSFRINFDKPTDPFAKSVVKAAEVALKTYQRQSGACGKCCFCKAATGGIKITARR